MTSTQFISDAIVQTYIRRLDELSEKKARHFLYRSYKATGRPELKEFLLKKSVPYTKNSQIVNNYLSNYEGFLARLQEHLNSKKASKVNDREKIFYLKKHVNLSAYVSLLFQLYYLNSLGIEKKVPDNIPNIDAIRSEILDHPNFIKNATTCATNLVFLSKNLGLFDIEIEYTEKFKKIFQPEEVLKSNAVFTNYVYGLTHAIIGASYFYINKIDSSKYTWCLEAFDTYQEEIFNRLSLDINAEVALCYKLLNIRENDCIQKVIKNLVNAFDCTDGYIHRPTENSFNFAEHTNAITLLLFNFDNIQLI